MKTVLIIEQVQPDWRSLSVDRYGIDFVIIEQREGVTAYSKAWEFMPARWRSMSN